MLLIIALAILFFRLRKRKQRASGSAAKPSAAGGREADEKKKADAQAELGADEVRELDGRPVVTELPTRLPSDRIPPQGKNGPHFRRSDQGWVVTPTDGTLSDVDGIVTPVEPHGEVVFELEGDSTPRSTFESRRT